MTTTTEGSKQAVLEQLTAEHRRLDEQLQDLARRRVLSPAEQVEMARLKKQKLWTKDRIARLA
ncbi:MAG TPA: YdcH family protein [Kofleriaceae bacterium]|nr:YdcH family protein [Kofleriaceae bacterium]